MVVGGLRVPAVAADVPVPGAHTGTPWGDAGLPGIPFGYTLRDFSGGDQQEGWVLLVPMIGLLLLGLFGAPDDRRIELDLHTQPGARWEASGK